MLFQQHHNMKTPTSSKGFAILFTILISSVILSIALGISSIAYNESILSASAREAHHSFFAADSGVECVLAYESTIANSPTITCGGNVLTVTTINTDTYEFYEPLVGGDHCAYVTIEKNVPIPSVTTLMTHVISHGYNIPCIHAQGINTNPSYTDPSLKKMVERVIEITY